MASNPIVQAAKKEVQDKTKKRKSGIGDENKKKAKMDRFARRLSVLESFENSETSKIPNGFERCVLDARNTNN